jgi:hypothetical protein
MRQTRVRPHFPTLVSAVSVLAFLFLSGCGAVSVTTASAFKLRMQGTYTVPAGAEGNNSPQSQTFLFKSLVLTKTDGTEVALYTDTAKAFRIIDRPQILYSNEDMSSYDADTFTRAVVEFDPTVVIKTRNGKDLNMALSSGTLELVENFLISKSKNQTLTIKVAWGNTITEGTDGTDSASSPTFSMLYSNE